MIMARTDFDQRIENLTSEEQTLLTQIIHKVLTHDENVPRIKRAIRDIHSGVRQHGLRNMSEILKEEFNIADFFPTKPKGTVSYTTEELKRKTRMENIAKSIVGKALLDPSVILARFGLEKAFKPEAKLIGEMLFVHRIAQQLREIERKTGKPQNLLAEIKEGNVSERIGKILIEFPEFKKFAKLPLNRMVSTDFPAISTVLAQRKIIASKKIAWPTRRIKLPKIRPK